MSWEMVKLGDLYDVHNGMSKPSSFFGHGEQFLTFSDVFNNYFLPERLSGLAEVTERERSSYSIKRGDVFVTRTSETYDELGMSSVALKDYPNGTYNGFTKRLRPKDDRLLPEFIGYYLRSGSFRSLFQQFAQMTTRASLKNEQLLSLEVPVPSLGVQERIADVLSAYDRLIENNRRQIALLEEAAQRLYKEWFVDLRFPGYEAALESHQDGLPHGWRMAQLADIVSKVTTGLNPRKNFVLGQGSNFYVTIKNMSDNDVHLDDRCDRVDDEAIRLINNRSDLQKGDVLFSAVGTIGRVCLVSIPLGNWNVNESIFTLRVNELASKEFLYLLLLSSDFQQYCKSNSHGVAQPGIRMADLKMYELKLPSENVMNEFTAAVGPLIESAQSLKANVKLLREARDRLLPKLMSGEIEVG